MRGFEEGKTYTLYVLDFSPWPEELPVLRKRRGRWRRRQGAGCGRDEWGFDIKDLFFRRTEVFLNRSDALRALGKELRKWLRPVLFNARDGNKRLKTAMRAVARSWKAASKLRIVSR